MLSQCSAYVPGPSLCTNGFPQNGACRGSACHACGQHTPQIPACMREDLGPHLIGDDGRPRFAKVATPKLGEQEGGKNG